MRNRFFALVVSIVSFAGITPESRRTLLDQSVLADGGVHEADFAQAVVRFLREDGIDGGEMWKRWLRDHLIARLRGVPRTLDIEALACWADTVPYLGDGIPAATELLSNRSIGLGNQGLRPNLPERALSVHGPVLAAHYAERIHNSSPSNYAAVHYVTALIEALRGALGDAGVQPLVEAATAKGLIGRNTFGA